MRKTYHVFKGILFVLLIASFVVQADTAFGKKKESKQAESNEGGGSQTGKKGLTRTQKTNFAISPSIFDLQCKSGERKTLKLRLDNPNTNPAVVSVLPSGLSLTKGGHLNHMPIASLPSNHLARHIVVESSEINLPKNSSKEITIVVDVPAGLQGTQYAGLSTASLTDTFQFEEGYHYRVSEYERSVGIGMLPGIGVTIKCHIEDTLQYSYNLKSVDLKLPRGNGPVEVKATYENTGNAELQFFPSLLLLDSSKRVVAKLKSSSMLTIYPGATKEAEFKPLYTNLSHGSYKAIASIPDPKYGLNPIEKIVTAR